MSKIEDYDSRLISLEAHGNELPIHPDVPYACHREYGSLLPLPDAQLRVPVRGVPPPPQSDPAWIDDLHASATWTWLATFWQNFKLCLMWIFAYETMYRTHKIRQWAREMDEHDTRGGQHRSALLRLMKTIEGEITDRSVDVDYEQPQPQYPEVPAYSQGAMWLHPEVPAYSQGTTWLHPVKPLRWNTSHRTYEEMRDDLEMLSGGRLDYLPPVSSEDKL